MDIKVKDEKLVIKKKDKEIALGYFDAIKLRIALNKFINDEPLDGQEVDENEEAEVPAKKKQEKKK
jgi:hypothetical protein